LVEHPIDLSAFEARYQNDSTGARAIHPKLLLKLILFAYSRGMISSRQIERLCSENVLFMALSGGYRRDHCTPAHFVSSMMCSGNYLPWYRILVESNIMAAH
jgi:transposase